MRPMTNQSVYDKVLVAWTTIALICLGMLFATGCDDSEYAGTSIGVFQPIVESKTFHDSVTIQRTDKGVVWFKFERPTSGMGFDATYMLEISEYLDQCVWNALEERKGQPKAGKEKK